jgi:hypothetical protein
MVASMSTAHAGTWMDTVGIPRAQKTCDLHLEKAGQQVHAQITCGETVMADNTISISPRRVCEFQLKGVEQIDHNFYYVHTFCGVESTLVFQLVGDDTIRVTNAENY